MATRAWIAVHDDDGYHQIYSHWDGYPSHLGKVLSENYNTYEKAMEIIMLGDVSSVDVTLDKCEFYARDRGEELNPARLYPTLEELKQDFSEEYLYVLYEGSWKCYDGDEEIPQSEWSTY